MSPSLTSFDVVVSIAGYCIVYLVMFSAGFALILQLIRRGPAEGAIEPDAIESGRPQNPVQALPSAAGEGRP